MGNATRVVAGLVTLCFVHGAALAQPPPPPPPGGVGPAPATGPEPTRWVGAGLVLVPAGTLTFEGGGMEDSVDMESAYGLEVVATRAIGPSFDFVVAPRVLGNIRGDGATESATQLDLRLGLAAGMPLPPSLHLFGYGLAGWSMIFPPFDEGEETFTPMGLCIAFGAGAGYLLNPRLMLTATLGYQLGFQKTTIQDTPVTLKDDLLDFTVGIKAGLD